MPSAFFFFFSRCFEYLLKNPFVEEALELTAHITGSLERHRQQVRGHCLGDEMLQKSLMRKAFNSGHSLPAFHFRPLTSASHSSSRLSDKVWDQGFMCSERRSAGQRGRWCHQVAELISCRAIRGLNIIIRSQITIIWFLLSQIMASGGEGRSN